MSALSVLEALSQFYSMEVLRTAIATNNPRILNFRVMNLYDLNALYALDHKFVNAFLLYSASIMTRDDILEKTVSCRKLAILIMLYVQNYTYIHELEKDYYDGVIEMLYEQTPVMLHIKYFTKLYHVESIENYFTGPVHTLGYALKMSLRAYLAVDSAISNIISYYRSYLRSKHLGARIFASFIIFTANQTMLSRNMGGTYTDPDPLCNMEDFHTIIPEVDYYHPLIINYINYVRELNGYPQISYTNNFSCTLHKYYIKQALGFN